MKMSKKTKAIVSAGLIGALCIGGAFAYFTDKADLVNTFKFSGKASITAGETMNPDDPTDPGDIPYEDPTNPVPGQTISKQPYFTNSGDIAVYARAKVTYVNPSDMTEPEVVTADNWLSDLSLLNETGAGVCAGWNKNADGYYYYDGVVDANETVDTKHYLFTGVKMPSEWNNTDLAEKVLESVVTTYYTDSAKTTPVIVKTVVGDTTTYALPDGTVQTQADFDALSDEVKGNWTENKNYALVFSKEAKVLITFEVIQSEGFDSAEEAFAGGKEIQKSDTLTETTESK